MTAPSLEKNLTGSKRSLPLYLGFLRALAAGGRFLGVELADAHCAVGRARLAGEMGLRP